MVRYNLILSKNPNYMKTMHDIYTTWHTMLAAHTSTSGSLNVLELFQCGGGAEQHDHWVSNKTLLGVRHVQCTTNKSPKLMNVGPCNT
jgi:hypothetical protein